MHFTTHMYNTTVMQYSLREEGEAVEEALGDRCPFNAVSTRASMALGCSFSSLVSSLPVSLVTTTTGTGGVWRLEASLSDNLKRNNKHLNMAVHGVSFTYKSRTQSYNYELQKAFASCN